MSAASPGPAAPRAAPGRRLQWRIALAGGALIGIALLGGVGLGIPVGAGHAALLHWQDVLPCALLLAAGGATALWWLVHHGLVRIAAGRPLQELAAREAPREARDAELLHLLYEKSPLALTLQRQGGGYIRANPAFLKLTGYTAEELRAFGRAVPISDESAPAEQAAALQLHSQGWFAPYECELLNSDGMRVPVRISGVQAESGGGEPLYWSIIEDITARKQMIAALKYSESEARMLSAVASHTHNMVVICDQKGRIEWVNQAFEGVTGYARREVVRRMPGELLQGPDTDPAIVAHMRERIAAQQGFTAELLNYAKDGRAYWVALECAPVFDHAGVLERYVAIERDVTATRTMHQALAQS